jgi:hypothetical protein
MRPSDEQAIGSVVVFVVLVVDVIVIVGWSRRAARLGRHKLLVGRARLNSHGCPIPRDQLV